MVWCSMVWCGDFVFFGVMVVWCGVVIFCCLV